MAVPKDITISSGMPKQQDTVSCGVYVVEWALRFMTNHHAEWESPDELRKKHESFMKRMQSSEGNSFFDIY